MSLSLGWDLIQIIAVYAMRLERTGFLGLLQLAWAAFGKTKLLADFFFLDVERLGYLEIFCLVDDNWDYFGTKGGNVFRSV